MSNSQFGKQIPKSIRTDNSRDVEMMPSDLFDFKITFQYQTQQWQQPAHLSLTKLNEETGVVTVEVKAPDSNNVQCLDASDFVRFGLIGNGTLIDNMGTSTGSRYVQLYNGIAIIKIITDGGQNIVSANVGDLPIAFLEL